MSANIDQRVVEMRFDNKQFEAGAKETISTLDRLKQALNLDKGAKAFNDIDKAAKGVSLDGIAAGIDALNQKFSVFGIAGQQVIRNITNSLMSFATKTVGFVNDAIVSGGKRRAMNIENAHFQLQALLKDEEKVQEVMDNAMQSVDGTAYAYDEAAKAASMFAASGVQAGDQMLNALRGIVGTAAMTNSQFEGIANIFTAVAGQGRLMGDQLLQLSSRGLNAASTINNFVHEVLNGSAEASEGVKATIAGFKTGLNTTEGDIREFVSKGQISFDLFSEAMTWAFADSAERANETFTGAFANMKSALARIGAGFFEPIVAQNSEVVRLFNALRVRINDVKAALVFDKQINNVNALTRQMSNAVLSISKSMANFLENLDLTKTLSAFYYLVEAVKNVGKVVGRTLSPIGKAFKEVFLSFNQSDIRRVAESLYNLTSQLQISEGASRNLHDAFKGVFDVGKLLIDIFVRLLSSVLPIGKSVGSLGEGLVALAGNAGRALSSFSEWVRQSPSFNAVFETIHAVASKASDYISEFIGKTVEMIEKVMDLPIVITLWEGVVNVFKQIKIAATPAVNELIDILKKFRDSISDTMRTKSGEWFDKLTSAVKSFGETLKNVDFSQPNSMLGKLAEKVSELLKSFNGSGSGEGGLNTFLTNLKGFFLGLGESFSFDNISKNIESLKSTLGPFTDWLTEKLAPIFSTTTAGNVIAAGTGVGIIYSITELSKSIDKVAGSIKKIPDLLGGVQGVLKAYQEDLKADRLQKIAVAIGILTASLVALTFVDPERLGNAAQAIAIVSGALLLAGSKFLETLTTLKNVASTTDKVANLVDIAMKRLTRVLMVKALGKAVKDFATAVGIVAASIIGIAAMYSKDKEALERGVQIIEEISLILGLISLGMVALSEKLEKGAKGFQRSASGVLMLAASLGIIVAAINKIFKMEIPSDADSKLRLLVEIFAGLTLVAIAIGRASQYAEGALTGTGPILAMAVALYAMVSALQKVFAMEIGEDYNEKLGMFAMLIIGMMGVFVALGKANELAGGALKGAPAILATCLLIGAITGALFVLTAIPWTKLITGAISLGLVLTGVGAALYGAGKIADKSAAASVLAMATMIGAITAALAVLGMIGWTSLVKAVAALDFVLLGVAGTLLAASQICDNSAALAVLSFAALTVTIAVSLYKLAEQPWDSLIGAAAAMDLVLIGIAGTMSMMSAIHINLNAMVAFAEGIVGIIAIAAVLNELAQNPWQQLLAAATAVTEVLLGMSVVFGVATLCGAAAPAAIIGIGLLDVFIADLVAVLAILGGLNKIDGFSTLIGGGASILAQVGEALGTFGGKILSGFLSGVSSAFPQIGSDLGAFMTNGGAAFLEACSKIDPAILLGVKNLAEAILLITGYEIIKGISNFLGGDVSITKFAEELKPFGEAIKVFGNQVAGIDAATVEGAASAAKIMAEMAKTLPAQGGYVQKVFGEKSLADFAKQLLLFGPSIKQFSIIVKDIDPASVQGAADSAKIMAEVAKNLPSQGGLAEKIFGSHSLAEFGVELQKFGPSIVEFADTVKGVEAKAITGAHNIAMVMVALANDIPTTGGLITLFKGDNSLAKFGSDLSQFGTYMMQFYNSVSGINATALEKVIEEFYSLITLAKDLESLNVSGMYQFSNGLTTLAQTGIDQFIHTFEGSHKKVKTAINDMLKVAIDAIDKSKDDFRKSAESISKEFMTSLSSSLDRDSKSITRNMEQIGSWVGEGLAIGMRKSIKVVRLASQEMASVVEPTIANTIHIGSPPPPQIQNGEWVGEGLAIGMVRAAPMVQKASENLGKSVTDPIKSKLDQANEIFSVYGGVKSNSGTLGLVQGVMGTMNKLTETQEKHNEQSIARQKAQTGRIKQAATEAVQAETDYWAALLAAKKAGQEAEKYQDMTYEEFQKEVLKSTVDALKEYKEQFESTRDSFMNSVSLFSEVAEREEVTKEQLQENLASQIRLYDEYIDTMNSLNERLEGKPILDYLQTLGVDSIDELKAINSMSDYELSRYADLYDIKYAKANEMATLQLQTMKTETEAKLADIFGTMTNSVDLYDFAAVFDGSLASITTYVEGLIKPIEEVKGTAETAAKDIPQGIVTGINEGFENADASSKIMENLTNAINTAAEGQKENAKEKGSEIGKNVTEGVGEGMISNPQTTAEKAQELISNIENALKAAGEINSPSALTSREVGQPIAQGVAEGMVKDLTIYTGPIQQIMNAIVTGFASLHENATSIGTVLMDTVNTAIHNKAEEIKTEGRKSAEAFIEGFKKKYGEARTTGLEFSMKFIEAFQNKISSFVDEGVKSASAFLDQFESRYEEAYNTGSEFVGKITGAFSALQDNFFNAGKSAGQRIVDGLREMMGPASEAGRAIADAAYKAAAARLGSSDSGNDTTHSGDWGDEDNSGDGDLDNDLRSYSVRSMSASVRQISRMARAISNISENGSYTNDQLSFTDLDFRPMTNSVQQISAMFNRSISENADNVASVSSAIRASKEINPEISKSSRNKSTSGKDVTFIQNNYSPKALSRIEIYRQTRNQLAQFKEATRT